jgi:preprotein translocase subunit SecD
LVERGRLEIFDLEGDLVAPSIDRQGNPVASMRPPRARAGTEVAVCGGKASHAFLCPGNADPSRKSYYLIRPLGRLTNRELARRRIRSDIDALGNPIVRLSFTPAGDRAFQVLTRRLYVRGRLRRTAQHFAVVLDGRIVTFPQIDWTDPTLSDGISGGGEITGVTVSEAKSTAAILRSQVLPVALRVVR